MFNFPLLKIDIYIKTMLSAPNNQWTNYQIRTEIEQYTVKNENDSTPQNLSDAAKAVLRVKHIAKQA